MKELYASGFIHPMTGKKHTKSAKQKNRLATFGKKASPETKAKMSKSNKNCMQVVIKVRIKEENTRKKL